MIYNGTWLVLAILAIILILYALGHYWAHTHGLIDESAKYAMLENERSYDDDKFRKLHPG